MVSAWLHQCETPLSVVCEVDSLAARRVPGGRGAPVEFPCNQEAPVVGSVNNRLQGAGGERGKKAEKISGARGGSRGHCPVWLVAGDTGNCWFCLVEVTSHGGSAHSLPPSADASGLSREHGDVEGIASAETSQAGLHQLVRGHPEDDFVKEFMVVLEQSSPRRGRAAASKLAKAHLLPHTLVIGCPPAAWE